MPHERAVISQSVVSHAVDHDGAKVPPSQLTDYYRWVDSDRGVLIYINFETAERLQIQVLRGLDCDGGTEVGGILLGRTELHEGRMTTVIDDFEPVPRAYSGGPLYSPTSAETAEFEAASARHESEPISGLSIIGYYRSHNRENLYLSPDDLVVIRRAFAGAHNVFLLIKPLSMRACTGGFFFWEDGNIQTEFTLEVPFAPVRPPSLKPSDTAAPDDFRFADRLDTSGCLATDPLELSLEPDIPRPARWHGRTRDLTAGALGIVLSLGAFGYWQVRRFSVANHVPVARKVTGSLQLPPVPAQILSTKVETIPIPSLVKQPLTYTPIGASQERTSRKQLSKQLSQPAAAAVAESKLEEAPSLPGQTKIGEWIVAPAPLAAPPVLQNTTPSAIVPPRVELVIPSPPIAAVPNTEPGPPRLPSKTSFVGPQIIYRVNPAVPLDVRSLISGETQIDVTVKIDAAGKVIDAQVTSTRGAAARLVVAEAIKAARLFRFQPARENDRVVQSRMVLTFRFKRTVE